MDSSFPFVPNYNIHHKCLKWSILQELLPLDTGSRVVLYFNNFKYNNIVHHYVFVPIQRTRLVKELYNVLFIFFFLPCVHPELTDLISSYSPTLHLSIMQVRFNVQCKSIAGIIKSRCVHFFIHMYSLL